MRAIPAIPHLLRAWAAALSLIAGYTAGPLHAATEPTAAAVARWGQQLATLAPDAPAAARLAAARAWAQTPASELVVEDGEASAELFRLLALHAGPEGTPALRRQWAEARLALLRPAEAGRTREILAALEHRSPLAHGELLAGRLEEFPLRLLLETATPAASRAAPATAPTRTSRPLPTATAAELLDWCWRRNPDLAAHAALEGLLSIAETTDARGDLLEITLVQRRPDSFRLQQRRRGRLEFIVACDGRQAWRQTAPGQVEALALDQLGELAHYREFDPLLVQGRQGRVTMERLADGRVDQRPTFRLRFIRDDGSDVVAHVDQEEGREVARELPAGLVVYRRFQPVGSLVLPFVIELQAQQTGSRLEFRVQRPDPVVLPVLFDPPEAGRPDAFILDALLHRPTAASQP